MRHIVTALLTQPLLFSAGIVIFGVSATLLPAPILSLWMPQINQDFVTVISRYITSFLFIYLLIELGWAKPAGLSEAPQNWRKGWPLAILPMMIIVVINLTTVDWNLLEFEPSNVVFWLAESLSIGIFEETMMRALVFYVLIQAWKDRPNGLFEAALVQALIFGGLHLIGLINGFKVDVFAQVIYATLLGIGFAGVVAYTRSIWSAVFAHSAIDAAGNLNTVFNPNFIQTPASIGTYAVLITIIAILITAPGIWCLQKARLAPQK